MNYYHSEKCKNKIPENLKKIMFFIINLDSSNKRLWILLRDLRKLDININLERIRAYKGTDIINDHKLKKIIHSNALLTSKKKLDQVMEIIHMDLLDVQ